MSAAQPIIVIADDLSGAAELAGIAFAHGLTAEVQRQFESTSSAQVIAVDTDSRNLPPQAAAVRVRSLTKQILAARPAWLFKKVDSVLRGNVRVEIAAILEATKQPKALLIPANPTRGRVIINGKYLVDGIPLDQTQFAQDPDYPRRSAEIQQLLKGAGDLQIHTLTAGSPLGAYGVFFPDIATSGEIAQFAKSVASDTLPAGAADFFARLLAQHKQVVPSATSRAPLSIEHPALLVCGSRASWPTRLADCTAAGVPSVIIDPPPSVVPVPSLLLGISDSQPIDPATAVAHLADFAARIIVRSQIKTLLAEGGATAVAISQRLDWTRFQVIQSDPAGVGVLQPLSPSAPRFLIKPGSYAWPPEIWRSFCGAKP